MSALRRVGRALGLLAMTPLIVLWWFTACVGVALGTHEARRNGWTFTVELKERQP